MEIIQKDKKIELHKTDVMLKVNSVNDLFDFIKDTPKENHSRVKQPNFNKNWEDAIEVLRNGNPDISKQIDIRVNELQEKEQVEDVEVYIPSNEGQFFDIGAFCSGEPEYYLKEEYEETVKVRKEVDMVINNSFHCGITPETIINYGSCVLNVIDKLIYQGNEVNIQVVSNSYNLMSNGKYLSMSFNISAKESYSKDLLAYLLCDSSYIRNVFFACEEIIHNESYLYGYGKPEQINNKSISFIKKQLNMKKETIVINTVNDNLSLEEIKSYVEKKFNDQV